MASERSALRANPCLLCGDASIDAELFPSTVDLSSDLGSLFSARRTPDRRHHRIVRCERCGLVRSDPVLEETELAELYAASEVTYDQEVPNLSATYGALLRKALASYGAPPSLLEIGCGSGFFLVEALRQGVAEVIGVEPSRAAIADAPEAVRPLIVQDMMRPGLFAAKRFGVIAMFHVFDHLPKPQETLAECRRVISDDGRLLCVVHNVDAMSARLLKERSPIFDVEHTYLYSPTTIERLLNENGFDVIEMGPLYNRYSLRYLLHLAPLPSWAKAALERLLSYPWAGRRTVRAPLGNLYVIAAPSAASTTASNGG